MSTASAQEGAQRVVDRDQSGNARFPPSRRAARVVPERGRKSEAPLSMFKSLSCAR